MRKHTACNHVLHCSFSTKALFLFAVLPCYCLNIFIISSSLLILTSFFLLSSMWVDEPGNPRPGYIYGLCSCKCPAVSDRRNAHPPSLHPKKWRRSTSHWLPAQPQPRWRELYVGCPSTCTNQWRLAYPRLRTALAEVHHLLRERLRWVGRNECLITKCNS